MEFDFDKALEVVKAVFAAVEELANIIYNFVADIKAVK